MTWKETLLIIAVIFVLVLYLTSGISRETNTLSDTYIDTRLKQYQVGAVSHYSDSVYVAWSTPWATDKREMCQITKEQYDNIQKFNKNNPTAPLFLYCDWLKPLTVLLFDS